MARPVPALLVGLLFSFLFLAAPARAQEDPFTVTGVPVDATAATVAQAREQALVEGQRIAYRRLMEQLLGDPARVPRLADRDIAALVDGFEVQQERASAVRYIATLSITFRPNAVRNLLRTSGAGLGDPGSGGLSVRVPLEGLQTWVEIRRRLASTGILEQAKLRALSRSEAILDLAYAGGAQQLRAALAQRELALVEIGGEWTLKLTAPLPPPAAAPAATPAATPAPAPPSVPPPAGAPAPPAL